MVVREKLNDAIRDAADREERKRACTLRLIQAAIRDRDQKHCEGAGEKIAASAVADLLEKMIAQREEKIKSLCPTADHERIDDIKREIATIREFVPAKMDEPTMVTACAEVVESIGAAGLRDVGRTMAALKNRYPGQIDINRASCVVKGMLR